MSATRLLIVDDEEKLLELLSRYMERRGFEVEACLSAEAAWEIFSKDPEGFSLVITDLTLPGMSGAELVERMRGRNPAIPALIASGYPHVPVLHGVGFLQKPFLPKMLVEEVEKALKS